MIKQALKYLSSFILLHTVEKRKGEINSSLEVVYYNGRYLLDSARANYSFGGLHTVLQRTFSKNKIYNREVKNALILGFGSGSAASILQDEYKKDCAITGVEMDPVVIDLAKKYFSLDRYKNLTLHCEDAYDFVQHCEEKFDLVVMDVFIDLDVPDKFSDEVFITSLGKLLSPKGILFYNLVIHNEKIRDKGTKLFEQMNRLIGDTEWSRIIAQKTENWVFVCDKTKKQE